MQEKGGYWMWRFMFRSLLLDRCMEVFLGFSLRSVIDFLATVVTVLILAVIGGSWIMSLFSKPLFWICLWVALGWFVYMVFYKPSPGDPQ
jgi:hypothetical protein